MKWNMEWKSVVIVIDESDDDDDNGWTGFIWHILHINVLQHIDIKSKWNVEIKHALIERWTYILQIGGLGVLKTVFERI